MHKYSHPHEIELIPLQIIIVTSHPELSCRLPATLYTPLGLTQTTKYIIILHGKQTLRRYVISLNDKVGGPHDQGDLGEGWVLTFVIPGLIVPLWEVCGWMCVPTTTSPFPARSNHSFEAHR